MFFEIDGIKGESTDRKHKDWIEIESWSWGANQTSSQSGGGGAGKVNVQDFSFVAKSSTASPEMMSSVAKGEHIKSAQLAVRKAGGKQSDYLTLKLTDVLITNYQSKGTNESRPTDNVTVNYGKLKIEYSPQLANGSFDSPIGFEWTIPSSASRVPNSYPLDSPSVEEASSFDYFLEIEGIKGESSDRKHKGEIEIQSFSWGVSQTGAFSSGSGGGAGKVSVQDFHFVAPLSLASPLLADAVISGMPQRRTNATLFMQKKGSVEFLKYELENVLISSYQIRSIDNELPLEEFAIQFGDLDATYSSARDNRGKVDVTEGDLGVRSTDTRLRGESLLDQTKVVPSAFDTFLQIDGIKGESNDRKHKNEFEIQSFSWGVSQSGSSSVGGGAGAGKVSMQDFHFAMDTSSASSELANAMAGGKHIPVAVLTVRRPGASTDYLKIKLEDILISSYRTQGSDNRMTQEEISINSGRIRQQYLQQTPSGGTGAVSSFSWSHWTEPVEFEEGRSILADTTPQKAPTDFFLKFDGIKGESADKDHKGEIELDGYSWGMSRKVSSSDRSKQNELQLFDFDFKVDTTAASPPLLAALAQGKHFPQAILTARNNSTGSEYLKFKLTDIVVSSYALSGSNGQPTSDSLSLNFTKIQYNSRSSSSSASLIAATDWSTGSISIDQNETVLGAVMSKGMQLTDDLIASTAELFDFAIDDELLEWEAWIPETPYKKLHWQIVNELELPNQEAESSELMESF